MAQPTESFTFGGWFKADQSGNMTAVARLQTETTGGFWLDRLGGEVSCAIWSQEPGGLESAASTDGSWQYPVWVHAVCRYAGGAPVGQVDAFVGGAAVGSQNVVDPLPSYGLDFKLGPAFTTPSSYIGWIDEFFFVKRALSDQGIERIWACGIDGSKCTCNSSDGREYETCGNAIDCSALTAPCNLASPF